MVRMRALWAGGLDRNGTSKAHRHGLAGLLTTFILLGLVLFLSGCASSQKKPSPPAPARPPSGTAIDQINLLAIPVALNFDDVPGPDGVVLKIFPGNRRYPQPIPIVSGTIEILMFDGILQGNAFDAVKPRKIWRYSAPELKPCEIQTAIGTGYQIAAAWGSDKPAEDRVSIVVRYLSPEGAKAYSAPSVISVTGN